MSETNSSPAPCSPLPDKYVWAWWVEDPETGEMRRKDGIGSFATLREAAEYRPKLLILRGHIPRIVREETRFRVVNDEDGGFSDE